MANTSTPTKPKADHKLIPINPSEFELDARAVVSVSVKVGQFISVTAEGTWIYGGTENSTADGDVTYQANRQQEMTLPLLSTAGPAGALVGIFIPASHFAFAEELSTTDLSAVSRYRFNRLMPNSILIGTNWCGISPFKGQLILFMNDALGGYEDNSGRLKVIVTATDNPALPKQPLPTTTRI